MSEHRAEREGSALSQKFLRGVSLNSLSAGLTQAISFLRSLIMARLLRPEDYGLVGLATSVVAAVGVLNAFNLSTNVLVEQDAAIRDQRRFLGTLWTADLIRQGLVGLILVALAYPAARFLGQTDVTPILVILAALPVLNGFGSIGLYLYQRDIEFRRLVLHRQISDIVTTVCTIVVAVWTRNVWALVFGQLAGPAVSSALSYLFHPFRPCFVLDRDVLRRSARFSSHLFAIGLLTYLTVQFDRFVVGAFFGPVVLGFYMVAVRLAMLPVDIASEVFGAVLLPAFAAKHREGPDQLARFLLLVTGGGSLLTLALALPLGVFGKEIVRVLYGDRWADAGVYVSILVLAQIFRGLARIVSPLFVAMRRPAIESRIKGGEATLCATLVLWLAMTGDATAVAWAGVMAYATGATVRFLVPLAWFPGSRAALVRTVLGVLGVGGVSVLAAAWFRGVGLHWTVSAILFEILLLSGGWLVLPELRQTAKDALRGARFRVSLR